jgi:hypothetical protein
MSKYDIDNVYIDGANPSFIKLLKLQIGEDADYDKVLARYKYEKLGDGTKDMKIVPVNNYKLQSEAHRIAQTSVYTGYNKYKQD